MPGKDAGSATDFVFQRGVGRGGGFRTRLSREGVV